MVALAAVSTRTATRPDVTAAARRKVSIVTSKCTIARDRPPDGTGVEFEMTHSRVSGDT